MNVLVTLLNQKNFPPVVSILKLPFSNLLQHEWFKPYSIDLEENIDSDIKVGNEI